MASTDPATTSAFCSSCGVEVEERLERCPLCRASLQGHEPPITSPYPEQDEPPPELRALGRRLRMIVIEVLTVLFFATLFAAMGLDYIYNGHITWSAFCAPALAAAWWYAWLLLFLIRRPGWLLAGCTLTTTCLLAAIDYMTPESAWFFQIALPILATIALATAGIIWISCFIRTSWANLAAMTLASIGLLCIVIDGVVSHRLHGIFLLTWSLPVSGSVLPPALFLLYVHYRLAKIVNLEKIFHL